MVPPPSETVEQSEPSGEPLPPESVPLLPAEDEVIRKAVEEALRTDVQSSPPQPDVFQFDPEQIPGSLLPLGAAFREDTPVAPGYSTQPTSPSSNSLRLSQNSNQTSLRLQRYNLRAGPIKFRFSSGLRLEANDNIKLSQDNREPDIILGPSFSTQAFWQVSESNALSLNLGFGYAAYVAHPEQNSSGADLSPGSEIAFNIKIGDVRLNLHDRFSITRDPTSEATLSNTATFGRFINAIGVAAFWNLNKLTIGLGYDYITDVSTETQFQNLNRTQHSVPISIGVLAAPGLNTGIEGGITTTIFDEGSISGQSNSREIHAGPFVESRITKFLSLRAGAGLQQFTFEQAGAASESESGTDGWYANLAVIHRVNSRLNHSLGIGHEQQIGFLTASQQINFVRYSASWDIVRNIGIGTALFYQDVKTGATFTGEHLRQYGGGLSFGYPISRKITMGAQYQFVYKTSDLPGQNYYQNRVELGFAYQF